MIMKWEDSNWKAYTHEFKAVHGIGENNHFASHHFGNRVARRNDKRWVQNDNGKTPVFSIGGLLFCCAFR